MRQLDQFNFHQCITDTPGLALVIFTAAGCSACRHWKQLLSQPVQGLCQVTLFEVDAGQDQALAREFEVFHLPALFLFQDGEYHCALYSEAHPLALRRALDRALSLPAEEAP